MILGIYGAGGLGREVLELARIYNAQNNKWTDIIFVIDGEPEGMVNGAKVYNVDIAIKEMANDIEFVIAIGEPAVREKLFKKLNSQNLKFATIVHPDVNIAETTTIGKGSIISQGCFISFNITIGDNVYIQPHASLGHDDVIKEGALLSGFTNIAGNVTIGSYSYLGLSVAVKERTTIGDNSIIGMFSAVYKDIESGVIAMGNPARVMKMNEDRKVFK